MTEPISADEPLTDHVIALAGMFQALRLVRQVAKAGTADSGPFSASMASLMALDAESVEAVFGGRGSLRLGFEVMSRQFGEERAPRDPELTRYAASLMRLERRLVRDRSLVETLRERLGTACSQAEHFSVVHENVIAGLADTYLKTVSTLGPRILVRGEPDYLRDGRNADKIRALLLAAVRAVVLWRQLGGTRPRLLLSRRRLARRAHELLDELE